MLFVRNYLDFFTLKFEFLLALWAYAIVALNDFVGCLEFHAVV